MFNIKSVQRDNFEKGGGNIYTWRKKKKSRWTDGDIPGEELLYYVLFLRNISGGGLWNQYIRNFGLSCKPETCISVEWT